MVQCSAVQRSAVQCSGEAAAAGPEAEGRPAIDRGLGDGHQRSMLAGEQNTFLVALFCVSLFGILVLIILCGEYCFNFETKRLQKAGAR
jgi:hypothetical protein